MVEEVTTPTALPEDDETFVRKSDRLPDPLNDRVMKDVPRPPNVELTTDRVFADESSDAPNA